MFRATLVAMEKRMSDSAAEWVGEGSSIWVDDCGWPEFDASAVDGDVPALEVDLLVVHGAQQATVRDAFLVVPSAYALNSRR